jgi:hypothetical protein
VNSILGGLGGGRSVGSLLTGFGGGTPVASLLGGLGGGTPVASLLGGISGGSLFSSINGVVAALENGTALPLLTNQLGSGLQTLSGNIAGLPATLQSLELSMSPGLLAGAASTGVVDIAGPYQTLYNNTVTNLQAFNNVWSANPTPFLHQFIENQIGYGHIVATSLQNAAFDFGTGVAALPSAFQSADQALLAGNVTGAVTDIGQGFANLFFTGLQYNTNGTGTVLGALGDLLPIAAIPGTAATNFANLIGAVSDLNITFSFVPPTFSVGLPLALALDTIGAPVTALSALGSSATTFFSAIQTGDPIGAVGALIDAPAVVANGFLNGQQTLTLDLPTSLSPLPFTSSLTAAIPLGGLLVPLQQVTATAVSLGVPINVPLSGTEFGGLLPALHDASEQLAAVITPA